MTGRRRSTQTARATRLVAVAAAAMATAGAAVCIACGTESSGSGPNGPCTRTSDCLEGLECQGGFCFDADSGLGAEGGAAPDARQADAAVAD